MGIQDIAGLVLLCLLVGMCVGIWLGNWLDQNDMLYACPRCLRNFWAAANSAAARIPEATEHDRKIRQLFTDKAVTLAKINTDVRVMCSSVGDAAVVLSWLEQQICNMPPFASGATVQCEQVSPDYHSNGELADNCRCMPGHVYDVQSCIQRPDSVWFVEIYGELHRAEDFRLWENPKQPEV